VTNALENVGRRHVNTAAHVGQVTAVEQARAVAEVAAAVQVAQQFPRDMDRVRRDMQIACSSMALARRAFYAVTNRGQGPSVHLARELAQVYGNMQSGIHELRRDDDRQESEIQAFAWDIERNGRTSRTFVVPHARMRSGARVPLVDLGDITNNNNNVGARALRECIFNQLPRWLREEAEDACRATLERGDGRSVAERAESAVQGFGSRWHVTEQQLVDRLERKRANWTPQDLATLEVIYRSIDQGETTADEQFPPPRVTAEEIRRQRPTRQQRIPAEPEPGGDDPAEPEPVPEGQQIIGDEPPPGFQGEPVEPDLRGKAR
jgi:hypothetical protein